MRFGSALPHAPELKICVHSRASWLIWPHANFGHRRRGFHRVASCREATRGWARVVILDDFNDFYDPQIKRANIAGFAKDVTVYHVDLRDARRCETCFTARKFDASRIWLRAQAFALDSTPAALLRHKCQRDIAFARGGARNRNRAIRLCVGSSVYGASKTVPFSEDQHLTQTLSPYGATKVAGEFLCSTYSHLYQMRVVALRYFTVYGPRQRPDLAIHQFTRHIQPVKPSINLEMAARAAITLTSMT